MITRYCIDGGMNYAAAYNLSDFYIQSADQCLSIQDVSALHITMCIDYVTRMKQLHTTAQHSKYIEEAIDYIYDNLHTRITQKTLAEHLHLSPAYLSRLFKEETGEALSTYIQNKKLETACQMLAFSDFSVADIAFLLSYPSHSYFTEQFRKKMNMTPLEYRSRNYKKFKDEV